METRTFRMLLAAALAPVMIARGAARVGAGPILPEQGFAAVVERTAPSVVRVVTAGKARAGEGSGVVVTSDGHLLTNHHVVDGAAKITVHFHDDRELPAQLVASDPLTDLAVLKVDAAGLSPVEFGDSDRVRAGDYALAIGNPFGAGTSVSLGIISAKAAQGFIQTDASINPGNSGGPLLDIDGRLIGINTSILTASGGSNGVGFAIPSNLGRPVMAELMATGQVRRGYLGAEFQPLTPELREAMGVRRGGAVVSGVAAESPAAKSGLRKGDVLVAMNGRPVRDTQSIRMFAALAKPGQVVEMTVARADAESIVAVMLGERANAPGAPDTAELPGALVAVGPDGRGPVVTAVDPQGPSAAAGLMPGDVIIAVDRREVASMDALRGRMAGESGRPALVEVSRSGATYFLALPRP